MAGPKYMIRNRLLPFADQEQLCPETIDYRSQNLQLGMTSRKFNVPEQLRTLSRYGQKVTIDDNHFVSDARGLSMHQNFWNIEKICNTTLIPRILSWLQQQFQNLPSNNYPKLESSGVERGGYAFLT